MNDMNTTLTMLGTGNAMCTRCYNTCFYLRTAGGGVLVDAGGGNGIFRQLYRGRVAVEEIHHLIVTPLTAHNTTPRKNHYITKFEKIK